MNNSLAVQESGNLITFDDEKKALIKRTIAKGATDDEFALFMHQAQKTGLDPLARQIYFQKYKTRDGYQIAIITGIDGYRLVADRTGKYAGNDEPIFDGKIGNYPAKATVTIWKVVAGVRCNFSASAYWQEYYPGDVKGFQWRKMPHVMLAKCAEAAALRKAFPADLSGVYTHDEMEQANLEIVEGELVTPEPPKNHQPPPPEPTPEPAPAAIEIPDDVDTNDLLMGKVEQPEPEPRKVEAGDTDSKIADARAWLEEKGVTTLGVVADALVMTGLYGDRKHVANALNGADGQALRDKGLKVDLRANVKATTMVFDWAIARKVEAE